MSQIKGALVWRMMCMPWVDGPAEKAGLQTSDVILSVNGKLVANAEQLRNKVNGAGKRLAVLVLRENSRLYIPISLG